MHELLYEALMVTAIAHFVFGQVVSFIFWEGLLRTNLP